VIFIVVKFKVRPEYADGWLDHTRGFTTATRSEPGNLWFQWSRSTDNADEYVLLEAFRDAKAGEEHVTSEHFNAALADLPLLLAEVPRIVNVEVPGDDWSSLAEMSQIDDHP
jgi:quinol monooxygenase YgiN